MAEKTKKVSKKEITKTEKKESSAVKISPRLFDKYNKEIIPALMKTFSYKSIMQVPKLDKIVVNMGVGAAVQDSKVLDEAIKDLETITGQKASVRTAKKAISNFKLRQGMKIGAMVTLRREQIIFPEINIDKVTRILGMDITFVTNSQTDKEAFELLKAFGFPFKKKELNNAN